MNYDIKPDEYRALSEWLEDTTGDLQVPSDAVKALQGFYGAVQRKLLLAATRGEARSNRLQARIDRAKERRHQDAAAGKFTETGIDGAVVARALCACLGDNLPKRDRFSANEVMPLLYTIYADWLSSSGERAFIEHPKALGLKDSDTPIGPWFWAVEKAMKGTWTGTTADKQELAGLSPGLFNLTRNVASKYAPYIASRSMGAVAAVINKSFPFQECTRKENCGKWGKELSDASIWRWKKEGAGA